VSRALRERRPFNRQDSRVAVLADSGSSPSSGLWASRAGCLPGPAADTGTVADSLSQLVCRVRASW